MKVVEIYVLQGASRREPSEEDLVRNRFILRSSVNVFDAYCLNDNDHYIYSKIE